MRRQKLVLVVVVLISLLAVTIGVAAQEGEPLKIGLLTDQSGPLTIYGVEQENGFLLGLGAMSLALVLLAWWVGGPPPDPGVAELDEANA